MNIAFMGTPDFAVPSLEKIIDKYGVKLVFTQPDRPKGRGKKLAFSAVKEVALNHGIEIMQPVKLRNDREAIEKLKSLDLDFIIVVAFGQILTKEVLDIPKFGCINLHGSLLPKYRGSAPIQWAVINGENVSGNTTMLLDEGIDTGDILLKNTVGVSEELTSGELYEELRYSGADLLVETIEKVYRNEIVPQKQGNAVGEYASQLNKEMALIDWNKSAKDIHNLVRGLNPWPIAYTHFEEDVMKIYKTKVLSSKSTKNPGTIENVDNTGLYVATGDNLLLVEKIQFPNGKPLEVKQYLNGHTIEQGIILK
ncbi:methionyl-tRNA formyltransferase [Inconstantimicrobium mannanitabidum]|uniref:Methionyl-tRNA formyltransferase n=1 Tax=Inconstantimicrobium mannanitabidum TaxID=1604901 RepID=A0ACB5RC26_9CLOT|nr:methionyl-tRNA formyltransferase [Clostridium sp. TW13]GKX66256.1 methionyl-tRNA formyltransferase [Clostridium sp. TW13]